MFIFNKYRIKSNFIQNMITLKLKYRLKDEQDMSLIRDYQRQYSSCLHFLYNRISDNPSIIEKELRLLYDNVNNCYHILIALLCHLSPFAIICN